MNGPNPPRRRLLLDAVLHRPVGGPKVGAYPISDISFTLFEFSEPMLTPVAFVEGLASRVIL